MLGVETKDRGKKKVLFSLVGKRDPYNQTLAEAPQGFFSRLSGRAQEAEEGVPLTQEGSVLTVCRKVNPDILYLFPSGKAKIPNPENQTEDKAKEVKKIVAEWDGPHPQCHVIPLEVVNAADVDEVYVNFKNNVLKILNRLSRDHGQDGCEFFVDTTSGTPQMAEAVKLYLANAPIAPTYCQSRDPKHLEEGEERVVFVEPMLEETILLAQLDNDVDGFYFHSVTEGCSKLIATTKLRERKVVADILRAAFSAYEKMEVMQYDAAFDELSEVYEKRIKKLEMPRLDEILSAQTTYLGKMQDQVRQKDSAETAHNLVDLCCNMMRAFARGNYVDVLSRFWRLREGMMNFRLLKNHYLDKRNIYRRVEGDTKNKGEENYNKLMNSPYKERVDWEKGWVKNDDGLGAMSDILCKVFGDQELKEFEQKSKNILRKLRNVRNQTIVAHGMLPVSAENVKDCMSLGKQIIALIPKGQELYDQYPFTLANMKELVGLLKHV